MTPTYQVALERARNQVLDEDIPWCAQLIDMQMRLELSKERFRQAKLLRARREVQQTAFEEMSETYWLLSWGKFERKPRKSKLTEVLRDPRVVPLVRTGSSK